MRRIGAARHLSRHVLGHKVFSSRSRRGLFRQEQASTAGGFGLHNYLRSRLHLVIGVDKLSFGALANSCLRTSGCVSNRAGRSVISLRFSFRVSSLGIYLLFALSSLRERLSCSLRLSPLPLHGYPCGLLPLIPLLPPLATPECNEQTFLLHDYAHLED